MLKAIGPLRSMLEFLVCQRWLAYDPDRDWKLWMAEGHAARDLWQRRFREHAPALQPDDRRSLEQRAAQVGLSVLYDVLYRYESSAGPHPTLLSVDLLLEKHPKGLVLRGEPTVQFAPPPVYVHGAFLLYEALKGAAS